MTTTSRTCPDCNEQIGDVAHWHDERPDERECNCAPGQAEMGQAGPDCPVHFEQSIPAAPDTEPCMMDDAGQPCGRHLERGECSIHGRAAWPNPDACCLRNAFEEDAHSRTCDRWAAQAGPPPLDESELTDIIEQAIFEADTGLEAAMLAAERIVARLSREGPEQ